ncbi:MAG: hypothetical protein WKF88_09885 [Ferruginibacter sp.]
MTDPKKTVITMHQKPDGDAMGSSLGLGHFLTALGHEVKIISPTNWASFFNWMPGVYNVLDYERQTAAEMNVLKMLIGSSAWTLIP